MSNRIHMPAQQAARPTPLVEYTDGLTEARGRLGHVPAGLFVVATGLVYNVQLHGTADAPRAVFTLLSDCGGSTIVALDADAYMAGWGLLVHGHAVTVHGLVVRPFRDAPAFIQTVSVHAPALAGAR